MTQEIKSSIRLPKTDFAMKAKLTDLDKKVLALWQESNIYQKIIDKNSKQPIFMLHDGPPYANGHIHIGHALNKILKDIMLKAYSIQGYQTPFVLGWDCHGLPIEWKIEERYKAKGKKKEEIEVNVFRQECKEFADKWVGIQQEEFKQLGIFADYQNPYITTQTEVEATIVASIFQLLKQGSLYQGKRPVLWSCVEQTALAEAEVEYYDKKSTTIFTGFEILQAEKSSWQGALIAIWTTTPWTLPANQALAYGQDIMYGLYQIQAITAESLLKIGLQIVLSNELADKVLLQLGATTYKKLEEQRGLADIIVAHPLASQGFSKNIPTLSADFVDTKTGTGVVHIAPSHGEDDFYLCQSNNIIAEEIVLASGCYIDTLPLFAKQHIFKVASDVLSALAKSQTLLGSYEIEHSFPHSWRSKAPLIYRLTTQWFISLDYQDIRKKALKSLEEIKFQPLSAKNRLKAMLSNRPDWCISRQRSWGVPLSIFIHKETKQALIDDELFSNIVTAFKDKGANAWFNGDNKKFIPKQYNPADYLAISDVIDVWVDSGLSYKYVLQKRENMAFPADIYLEGSDQHRGWFQSSLVMALLLGDIPPYKRVITHGFTMDERHQKMSKSLGNTITPQQIAQQYGTDILRLWVASSDTAFDIKISNNILIQQTEIYKKIRNTLRYILANLNYYKAEVNYNELAEVDKWLLHKLYEMDQLFIATFRQTFIIHHFFTKLFNFILLELSAFFFDIKKDILYCEAEDSETLQSTLSVLHILNECLLKWLAPFIPFTMEEVYAKRYNCELGKLFLHDFIIANTKWLNDKIASKWQIILEVRKVITGALELERAEKNIGSSLESAPIVYVSKEYKDILDSIDLAEICITSFISVELVEYKPDTVSLFSLPESPDIFVEFKKSKGKKCLRCWKFFKHLENNLCSRCNRVV